MRIIRDILGTHVALHVATRTSYLVTSVLFQERFLALITFSDKCISHLFFNYVLRRQNFLLRLIFYSQHDLEKVNFRKKEDGDFLLHNNDNWVFCTLHIGIFDQWDLP